MSISPRVLGKDFNYFTKITVTDSEFSDQSNAAIAFPIRCLTLLNEGTTTSQIIEYSFNGHTVHGDMTPTKGSASLSFEDRAVSGIWFRVKSGSAGPITVRVEAWATK